MKKTPSLRLSLRTTTVRQLAGQELDRAAGGFTRWTVTLGLSCMSVCPSDECTIMPPCTGTGGGGGHSGAACPK